MSVLCLVWVTIDIHVNIISIVKDVVNMPRLKDKHPFNNTFFQMSFLRQLLTHTSIQFTHGTQHSSIKHFVQFFSLFFLTICYLIADSIWIVKVKVCVNFVSFQVTFGTWPTCILTPSIRHRAMSCEVSVIDFDAAKLIENLNKPKQTRSTTLIDKLPNSLNQLLTNSQTH